MPNNATGNGLWQKMVKKVGSKGSLIVQREESAINIRMAAILLGYKSSRRKQPNGSYRAWIFTKEITKDIMDKHIKRGKGKILVVPGV